MDTDHLTITTIRDGAVCTLIVDGDLDISAASGFLQHASRVVGDRTERLVLDLAGVTFLDCSELRALAIAAGASATQLSRTFGSLSPSSTARVPRPPADHTAPQKNSPGVTGPGS